MNDKIKINLNMAGDFYPLTIDREEEEVVRSAARMVDERLNAYREYYRGVPQEKIWAMLTYQLALENLKLKQRNDTAPYAAKIEELTEVLEDYFKSSDNLSK